MNEPYTIYEPNGKPYLSLQAEEKVLRVQIHRYDTMFDKPLFFVLDRRTIPELIDALEKIK